jgi:hypothetical protein
MGTDISGFIECRAWKAPGNSERAVWRAAIDLFVLNITRNYDAFGCLFGIRNFANFRPLAEGRGLPADASDVVRAELDGLSQWPEQAFGTTWISWAELASVDWDERAAAPDSRLHEYRQTDEGLKLVGKSGWSAAFARAVGLTSGSGDESRTWPEGSEWLVDDVLYRSEVMTRRGAVPENGEWKPVWDVMAALAALHGDENVRLVVWFDN